MHDFTRNKGEEKTRRQQNSPVGIRVRKPPKRRLDWNGLSVETTKKTEAPGHRRRGTMNTPHVSMANVSLRWRRRISIEQRPKFGIPSLTKVTSPYE